jgi:hypothetical protein
MTMIHFQDSNFPNQNTHDRSFKPGASWHDEHWFSTVWNFGEYVAINEITVKFYDSNSLRIFIHGTPEIFGCKVWAHVV